MEVLKINFGLSFEVILLFSVDVCVGLNRKLQNVITLLFGIGFQ